MKRMSNQTVDLLGNSDQALSIYDISESLAISTRTTRCILSKLISEGTVYSVNSGRIRKFALAKRDRNEPVFEKPNSFSEIRSASALIEYLSNEERFENFKYVYHYTTIDKLISIINSGYWYLGNPKNMNDQLEYSSFNSFYWDKLYFISLMVEQEESIGMWNTYGKDEQNAIIFKIPFKVIKKWLKEITTIREAKIKKGTIELGKEIDNSLFQKFLHRVSYYDARSGKKVLRVGNNKNLVFEDLYCDECIGYVKNIAWVYENEIRLRIETHKRIKTSGIAIKIPDDLFEESEIILGPNFSSDDKIPSSIKRVTPSVCYRRVKTKR